MTLFYAGDPGIPQAIIAYQIKRKFNAECTVHISWTSPANIPPEAVSHFMVQVDNLETMNITSTNNTLLSTHSPLCSCDDDYNISITAVNLCGLEGQSSKITIISASNLIVLEQNSMCDVNKSESTIMNNGKGENNNITE